MIEADFKDAMAQKGLYTKEQIIADGNLYRIHIEGDKKGSKNGWYVIFTEDDPIAAFGSWRTGERHTWHAQESKTWTKQQKKAHFDRVKRDKALREEEREVRYIEVAKKAQNIWDNAVDCAAHPYLDKKNVQSFGLRVHEGRLVVPLHDCEGCIHSLQFIDAEGNKRFLSGGRKKGCFFLIEGKGDKLLIAEGYATAASLHAATGFTTAIAFDAGNLIPVSKALKQRYPNHQIVVCADNDANTKGNPGITKARESAKAINAHFCSPPISGDFNDFLKDGNS